MNWDFGIEKTKLSKGGQHYEFGYWHRKNKAQQGWSPFGIGDFGIEKTKLSKGG